MRRFNFALHAFLLSCLAGSGSSQVELSWTGGILGQQVTYHTSTTVPSFYALLPSTTVGPTPLAIVDPTDPRSLAVGLDLYSFLYIGFSPGSLGQDKGYSLPLDPALSGLPLYAQGVSLLGATLFVDISNRVSFKLGAIGDTHTTIGLLVAARRGHSATTLQDGRVLIAGGSAPSSPLSLHSSLELYDPQTQRFTLSAATLSGGGRANHTATLLADGRVLLVGGYGAGGAVLASAVLYDPASDTLTNVGSSLAPRIQHTAVALLDGRVLVAGGSTAFDPGHPIGYPTAYAAGNATRKTALYDPATNTWTAGPDLAKPLTLHASDQLANGLVLIAGGVEVPGAGTAITTAASQLIDPVALSISATQSMPMALAAEHTPRGPIVPKPKIETFGGASINFVALTVTPTNAALEFSASSSTWSIAAPMGSVVMCGDIECLPNGVKNRAGGLSSLNLLSGLATAATDIDRYDPTAQTWSIVGSLTTARMGTELSQVDGGTRLLVTGAGPGSGGPDFSADCHVGGP